MQEDCLVVDPATGDVVPADGTTMGEIVMRGNIVMKGYLKAPEATQKAFADGWFWTGDLAVMHPDGYIEIRDRSKDIIISGGENISSIEIEKVLFEHAAVAGVAVVAQPDEKWGESPVPLLSWLPIMRLVKMILSPSAVKTGWVKRPKRFIFGPLPKTSTGKIRKNELRAIVQETG